MTKFLYAAIRDQDYAIIEVRRYRVIKELKTQIKIDPDYLIRVDGNWIAPGVREAKPDVVYKTKLKNAWHYFWSDLIFYAKPKPNWPGRKPVSPETDSGFNFDDGFDLDDILDRIPGMKERKEAMAFFGFEVKPTADELRCKVRGLSLKHHPDRGGDGRTFRKIARFAEVLA